MPVRAHVENEAERRSTQATLWQAIGAETVGLTTYNVANFKLVVKGLV